MSLPRLTHNPPQQLIPNGQSSSDPHSVPVVPPPVVFVGSGASVGSPPTPPRLVEEVESLATPPLPVPPAPVPPVPPAPAALVVLALLAESVPVAAAFVVEPPIELA
jgi:hypothetical protein